MLLIIWSVMKFRIYLTKTIPKPFGNALLFFVQTIKEVAIGLKSAAKNYIVGFDKNIFG